MDQVPLSRIAEYAAEDADYTWRLRLLLEPQLDRPAWTDLFYEVEMPLVSVLTDMEQHGISIDVDFLRRAWAAGWRPRVERLARTRARHAGRRFNLDSPKQLAEVLFDELKLPRGAADEDRAFDGRGDAGGARPRDQPPDARRCCWNTASLQKLRGTYVDALPHGISRRTGRVHTSFTRPAAVTGRLSSSDPNLQNIPIRTELGRRDPPRLRPAQPATSC